MCGICGFTGAKVPGLMNEMLDRLRHRGPDDQGTYSDQKISLGMTRLAIIDLLGGRQPMSNEEETVWVVFNGEIYNFVELRQELEAKGYRFKTRSDTETLVHGYEAYGSSVARKLNGMFAIAIWDRRNQTLALIRDRFGVKPLFYACVPEGLVFASEIKALLCHPRLSREIDDEALSHYLCLREIPAPWTVYKDIRVLPPGHQLVWNDQGLQISRWYEMPTTVRWKDDDEDELVERINDLLRDSIRLRLRSDVKYGAYLSGGIDSSMVVAIMSELGHKPVQTFCLTYEDSPQHKQDRYYARMVAERFSTDHHEYVMSWKELGDEIQPVLRHLDQPFAGVISSYWLSRFIKKHVTVALSGDGADDTFGSYGHHRLVGPLAAIRKARLQGKDPQGVDFNFFEDKKEWVLSLASQEPWEWRLAYGAFTESEKNQLLTKEGKERFGRYSTAAFLRRVYERAGSDADDLNRMLYLDIQTLLPNEILYYSDVLSMAHSVEVRTPYLDYRLVELANSIPGTLKIRKGVLKYILRRVASRYLPKPVLDRSKEGFVLPKNTWLRNGMGPMVQKVLSPERIGLHGYFDVGFVESLLKKFARGDDALTFKVWTLMVFQLWYEEWKEVSVVKNGAARI